MLESMLGDLKTVYLSWDSKRIHSNNVDVVRERILKDVRASEDFGLIMDETSDISRNEQVSLCLSFVVGGERKETFIGFFRTKSTTGEALYEYCVMSRKN